MPQGQIGPKFWTRLGKLLLPYLPIFTNLLMTKIYIRESNLIITVY